MVSVASVARVSFFELNCTEKSYSGKEIICFQCVTSCLNGIRLVKHQISRQEEETASKSSETIIILITHVTVHPCCASAFMHIYFSFTMQQTYDGCTIKFISAVYIYMLLIDKTLQNIKIAQRPRFVEIAQKPRFVECISYKIQQEREIQ